MKILAAGICRQIVNEHGLRHLQWMTPFQRLCLVLANVVLLIHAAFIGFVVVGLVLIWVGWFRGWAFVRNPWFRAAHLAAIGVVVAESLMGIECPLTAWEDKLRLLAGTSSRHAGSFIQDWVHRLIFYNWSEHTFTIIYIVFLLVVAGTFWFIPPRWYHHSRKSRS